MYRKLFSSDAELKKYQQESIDEAMQGLKSAEKLVPGITGVCSRSVDANQEYMQLLGGECSSTVLKELGRIDQEIEHLIPSVSNIMQQFEQQQKTYVQNCSTASPETPISSSLQEVKWLDDMVASSRNIVQQMQNDPEMQELIKNLTGKVMFPPDDQLG